MTELTIDRVNQTRLTNWKNEPSLQDLKFDFEASKTAHDIQVGKINRWNNLLKIEGSARPPKNKNRSSVQPKLIRRQAEWRYSALTEPFHSSNKVFTVKPATFEDGDAARQNEKVLNYQFRTKLNRIKFIDDFVRSTVDEGTCIVRIGWTRHTIMVTEEAPVWTHYAIQDEGQLNQFKLALETKAQDPRTYNEQVDPAVKAAIDYYEETGEATWAQQTGVEKVKVEKVLKNHPTAEVINPQNIYIDSSCGGDFDRAMFAIVSFETCLADLKKEGKKYRNLDQVDWTGSAPITDPDHGSTTPSDFNMKGPRKKVVAYEYWGSYDINGDGILVPIVATWIGNVLIRMDLNPFPDQKLPFVIVPYLPVKREVFGEPDAELLEDNQAILGAIMRGMIDLLGRSANGQQGFAKGMLDPINKRRFENGQDYEFNPGVNPQIGHVEHKYPELPQSAIVMLNLQNQEAEALTGVKSFSGGISGESLGDVAAGIKGVLDAAAKREMAILRRLAHGMVQIGEKFTSMNAVFLSEEETIRITNTQFETIHREDLEGNFDLEVDISTAEIDNAKAQDLAFMLQTIGPNTDTGIVLMILGEIAELKRMPELAQKIRTFQPQPNPFQEQMQQLQLAEMQAKVDKLKAEADLARARAEDVSASTDQKTLDFVEQESGTRHARDMEKQQAQAEGNQDLQVTKALTQPRKEGERAPDIEAAVGWNELTRSKPRSTLNNPAVPVDIPQENSDPILVDF